MSYKASDHWPDPEYDIEKGTCEECGAENVGLWQFELQFKKGHEPEMLCGECYNGRFRHQNGEG